MTPRAQLGSLVLLHALVGACGDHDTALDAASPKLDAGRAFDAAREEMDAAAAREDASLDANDANDAVAPPPCTVQEDGGLPTDLFCSGLYVARDRARLAAGVQPYEPGVVLWSDGAEKQRYLYLPAGARIDTSDVDRWRFPVGTKAWKEFRVDGALVETRLLWKRAEGDWVSGTYVWDERGSTATLNSARKGTILDGGYEIPAPRDCDKCHHGAADKLLGVEAVALALPNAKGVTLTSLTQAGSLTAPPTPTTVSLPEDATGKAAQALGYLHANCGMPCHSTRGLGEETQLVLRLRADEFWPRARPADAGPTDAGLVDAGGGEAGTDAGVPVADGSLPTPVAGTDIYHATIGKSPTTASVAQAFPGALRVTPGSHEQSLVWLLAHRRGNYQMPPLVSHRIDEVGMQNLAAWIDALEK